MLDADPRHVPPGARSDPFLTGADQRVAALAAVLGSTFQAGLGPDLAAIYAHGSLALGGFRWERSDLDLLIVVAGPLTEPVKRKIIADLLEFGAAAPPKGIELSIVTRQVLRDGSYPLAYELHFSPSWVAAFQEHRVDLMRDPPPVDPDLATHVAVARAAGIALVGPVPGLLLPVVPEAALLASLAADLPDPADLPTLDPASVVLNCCRTIAYLADGVIRSKAAGGAWALSHGDPADRPLAAAALANYERDVSFVFVTSAIAGLVGRVGAAIAVRQQMAHSRDR